MTSTFAWRRGLCIESAGLWCDAPGAGGVAFLSHAAWDASGDRLLCTDRTAGLLRALGRPVAPLVAPAGRPFTVGAARVELFPSGYTAGSASLLCEAGGGRALYAGPIGDYGAEMRPCDALCLWAPAATWRPNEAANAAFEAIDAGLVPVLLAPTPAEARAAARELGEAGLPVRAPPRACAALRQLGAPARALRGTPAHGEALVGPPDLRGSPTVRALLARGRGRAIALPSLAAGTDALVAYARACGAAETFVTGPGACAAAARLRGAGLSAREVGPPRQLALFAAAAPPG